MRKIGLFLVNYQLQKIQQSPVLYFDEIIGSLTKEPGEKGTRKPSRDHVVLKITFCLECHDFTH